MRARALARACVSALAAVSVRLTALVFVCVPGRHRYADERATWKLHMRVRALRCVCACVRACVLAAVRACVCLCASAWVREEGVCRVHDRKPGKDAPLQLQL
eukprot:58667-Pleurochrysis_carterae.AAC.1